MATLWAGYDSVPLFDAFGAALLPFDEGIADNMILEQ